MNGRYESYITDCSDELAKIKQWIDQNKMHSNIQYLVSYGVIKASGTTESIMKQILFDYLSTNCNSEAVQYFTKHIIDSSFNPSTGQIENLLSSINADWASRFQDATKASQEKADLNSLVKLRNSFAHGTAITASIENIITYFESSHHVLELLYNIVFPQ
ncbi:MAG: HEPN domain-containing protein [Oscillospiraceae bacterium]